MLLGNQLEDCEDTLKEERMNKTNFMKLKWKNRKKVKTKLEKESKETKTSKKKKKFKLKGKAIVEDAWSKQLKLIATSAKRNNSVVNANISEEKTTLLSHVSSAFSKTIVKKSKLVKLKNTISEKVSEMTQSTSLKSTTKSFTSSKAMKSSYPYTSKN